MLNNKSNAHFCVYSKIGQTKVVLLRSLGLFSKAILRVWAGIPSSPAPKGLNKEIWHLKTVFHIFLWHLCRSPHVVMPKGSGSGLYCITPHDEKLSQSLLYYITTTLHHATRDHFLPHCTALHHTEPHYTKLYHTTPHFTKLHHTTPHCTTLHHTTPHYTPILQTTLPHGALLADLTWLW